MQLLQSSLSITIYDAEEIPSEYHRLIEEATVAAHQAYAPYSQFSVGAAVLLQNGEIIAASNQENEVYNLGCCAERVALFYASSKFPNLLIEKLLVLTTTAPANHYLITPCGACRQVVLEYERKQNHPIEINMLNADGRLYQVKNAALMLPMAFELAEN